MHPRYPECLLTYVSHCDYNMQTASTTSRLCPFGAQCLQTTDSVHNALPPPLISKVSVKGAISCNF